MPSYLTEIWRSRHFWIHLSRSDLRSRWRRSFLGALWSIIQPLGLTLLISFVFSKLFNLDIRTYAPYILSGIIVWDFITSCVVGGSLAFVQADAYIKQSKKPLVIYTLRIVTANAVVLMLASTALVGWSFIVFPEKFGWHWIAGLTIFPALILVLLPLTTIFAYIGTRFRDVPHAIGLVMQALWFVSPVYFETKMFREGGLDALIDNNPIYHLLQLVRAPLLDGAWPSYENYIFTIFTSIFLFLLAYLIGRKAEKSMIFYL